MVDIVLNISFTMFFEYTFPSSCSVSSVSPISEVIILAISMVSSCTVIGYDERVSSSTLFIYACIPLDSDNISAIPIIPMLPANEVNMVLPFLVIKLFRLSDSAVRKFIETLLLAFEVLSSFSSSSTLYGLESSVIFPSSIFIILDEYFSAKSGLCVTIIISLSLEIFFSISIICTLVFVSSAPVGSSAKIISGSFTKALAIATLCICPPDS